MYQYDPWGDDWDQAAQIACLIHNAHFKGKKRLDKFKPSKPWRRQTKAEVGQQVDAFFRMMMNKQNGSSQS